MESKQIRQYPPVVIREQNDEAIYYRAMFKEFPKMIGGIGDTVSEAIEAAYAMLEAEIAYREEEGMIIPSPQIVPLDSGATGRITLRMSKSLHLQVAALADYEGVSINSFINEAIVWYVGRVLHGPERKSWPILRQEVVQMFNNWNQPTVSVGDNEKQDPHPGFGQYNTTRLSA